MAETKVKPESLEERSRKPRTGLSINDTIAANANLSVGAKGVDTSGVETGGPAGLPTPNVVPGLQGTGATLRGATPAGITVSVPGQEEISARAYQRWHQRGCPDGSPELDWREAEEELKPAR